MTKAELIDAVASSDKTSDSISKKAVAEIFEVIVDQMKASIKNDGKFAIPGFGTFTKKERAARDGRNPQTGQTIKIAASTTIGFKPAKDIKAFMEAK
ncbi:MAG: HU family DNA-binding protein [Deltaproteobacteria bacterium]|nr:HU family DNA-binding protein [Deltaproteobacteria bacterium]